MRVDVYRNFVISGNVDCDVRNVNVKEEISRDYYGFVIVGVIGNGVMCCKF